MSEIEEHQRTSPEMISLLQTEFSKQVGGFYQTIRTDVHHTTFEMSESGSVYASIQGGQLDLISSHPIDNDGEFRKRTGLSAEDFTNLEVDSFFNDFNVRVLDQPLSDAEALFLVAFKRATHKRPADVFIREVKACAAVGIKSAADIEPFIAWRKKLVDKTPYSSLTSIGNIGESTSVRELFMSFSFFQSELDKLDRVAATRNQAAFFGQAGVVERALGLLQSSLAKTNTIMANGILNSPLLKIAESSNASRIPSNMHFRLALREEPDLEKRVGVRYTVIEEVGVKPVDYKRIHLLLDMKPDFIDDYPFRRLY